MTSPEFKLLCFSLGVDVDVSADDQARKILNLHQVDWDDLYVRAEFHSIRPQLAQLLYRITPKNIPVDFTEKLSAACRENLYRQLNHVAEFLRIHKILEDANILAIPFKGFTIAERLYGDIGIREAVDVDLFVNDFDLEKISELMIKEGYQVEAAFVPYTFDQVRKNFGEYNFDRLEGDRRIFHFEFHRGISLPVYGMGIKLDDLKSQLIRGSVQGHEMTLFSPSASLLLTIMHHGGDDRFLKLQQVFDIAIFLKKHGDVDWDWVISKARHYGLEKVVYIAVWLASVLTGAKVPTEMKSKIDQPGIKRLCDNRVSVLSKLPDQYSPYRFNFSNWAFRMRSRTGVRLKLRITSYVIRQALWDPFAI